MNDFVDEDEEADLEDVEADSRRFLLESGSDANVSSQPWKIGKAGQQVGSFITLGDGENAVVKDPEVSVMPNRSQSPSSILH